MTHTILQPDLAREILQVGVVKFGAFRLKLHEKHPEAPLSPIYLSFRRPPKGPLTEDLIHRLGDLLYEIALRQQLVFDGVAGVPKAGDPFAEAFSKIAEVPQLWLEKDEEGAERRILPRLPRVSNGRAFEGMRILLIDDLVTQAHSKVEAVQMLGGMGDDVDDVLVLVDREQGGKEALAKAGLTLHAVWGLSELLEFYRTHQLITEEKYLETVAYLQKSQ